MFLSHIKDKSETKNVDKIKEEDTKDEDLINENNLIEDNEHLEEVEKIYYERNRVSDRVLGNGKVDKRIHVRGDQLFCR